MAISLDTFKKLTSRTGYFVHNTNIGVVEGNEGLYVIDSGTSNEDGRLIVETLRELYPSKKIKVLINTHAHPDHVSGNNIIKELTGAEIWNCFLSDAILRFPDSNAAIDWGGYPLFWLENNPYMISETCISDRIIKDNEKMELDGIDFEFISLDGHYYGQIGVLVTEKDEGKKTFFLGDAFFGNSMFNKFWLPYIFNPQEFRETVIKIESIDSDFYVPSHYEIATRYNIDAACENNIIVTYQLEKLILDVLKRGEKTQEEILCAVADFAGLKMKEVQYILIGATVRSYLSNMEKRELIVHKMKNNRMLWYAVIK